MQTPLAKTFAETLNLERLLLQREIQCNSFTNSQYSSSYSHVAAFLLILAQNLLHLMDQSSTTCILVANLMKYLELHLLCALIVAIEGVLELTGSHWNIQKKAFFATHCILRGYLLYRLGVDNMVLIVVPYYNEICNMDWGCSDLLYYIKNTINSRPQYFETTWFFTDTMAKWTKTRWKMDMK